MDPMAFCCWQISYVPTFYLPCEKQEIVKQYPELDLALNIPNKYRDKTLVITSHNIETTGEMVNAKMRRLPPQLLPRVKQEFESY